MENTIFWYCTPSITNLVSPLTRGQGAGDYDLSYLELISHEGHEDETECTFRFAALHLHAALRSTSITIAKSNLILMLELTHAPDLMGSRYLARLDWLFADPPVSMEAHEFGVAEMVREKETHLYQMRLTPVMLHLASPFSVMTLGATFKDEVWETRMPIRQAPKKPHACRQQTNIVRTDAGDRS